jgi:hypothetical protein
MHFGQSWKLYLFIYIILSSSIMFSQNEDIIVSLITCEPGDEIHTHFGHTAIRVIDPITMEDKVYNYGMFDYDAPGFTLKFMRGKLPYSLAVYRFSDFMREYLHYKRGVKEQKLNLTKEKKDQIVSFLNNNALPENREYKYDFFFDNCSTRIRDVFEKELAVDINNYTSKENVSYRDLLHQFLKGYAWTKFGIDLIIGCKADVQASPRDQMFLPEKFHDLYKDVQTPNGILLSKSENIIAYDKEKAERDIPIWFTPFVLNILLFIILCGFIYFQKEKYITVLSTTWYIVAFISSIIIVFLWFFTDHIATKVNWNILWLNPLYLFMFYKSNLNKKVLIVSLIVLSLLCLLNSFFKYIPQEMPIAYFWFFIPLLGYNLMKEK